MQLFKENDEDTGGYSTDNLYRPENRCVTYTYSNKHFCGGNLDSNPNLIWQRKKIIYFAQAK